MWVVGVAAIGLISVASAQEDDRLDRASALDTVIEAAYARGDHPAAAEANGEQLRLRIDVHGTSHVDVAQSQQNLAVINQKMGGLDRALELYLSAMATREELLGSDAPEIGETAASLGVLYQMLGRLDEAEEHIRRALAIDRATYGADHPTVARTLNGLADLQQTRGDLVGARALYDEALAIYVEKEPNGLHHAMVLNGLGTLLAALGDRPAALRRYTEALQIREGVLGPDHPDLASSLANIGAAHQRGGDALQAIRFYKRARSLLDAAGTGTPAMRAGILINLASAFAQAGGAAQAIVALNDVISAEDGPPTMVLLARVQLGVLFAHANDDRAVEVLGAAIAQIESGVAVTPRYASIPWEARSTYRQFNGDLPGAIADLEHAMAIREQQLDPLLGATSGRERIAAVQERRRALDLYLDMTRGFGDASRVWPRVLSWKGLALRSALAQRDALRSRLAPSPESAELKRIRLEIASLALSSAVQDPGAMSKLVAKKEALEREIAAAAGPFTSDSFDVDPADICGELAARTVMIDFVRYDVVGPTVDGSVEYSVFILDDTCDIKRVDLGDATVIDDAIASWRELLNDPTSTAQRVDRRGQRVHELIWDPIVGAVGEASIVLVVPDGATASVSFAALPVGDGKYLVEQLDFAYLDNPADMLRARPEPDDTQDAIALVIGGIDYDGTISSPANVDYAATRAACQGHFSALPGTALELDAVSRELQKIVGRRSVVRIEGLDASEANVAAEAEGAVWIHLATHGFFARDACANLFAEGSEQVLAANPLLRSGVVLAGANQSGTSGHDGIWTAEEVATLDLRDTRMVVLSACETGLGEVVTGEGVLGLRRAFTLAGGDGLVMSLWPVPDDETTKLMSALYRNIRRGSPPIGIALGDAQRAQLEANRNRLDHGNPQSWAAFIVAGPGAH